jgi:hypothetical protein
MSIPAYAFARGALCNCRMDVSLLIASFRIARFAIVCTAARDRVGHTSLMSPSFSYCILIHFLP